MTVTRSERRPAVHACDGQNWQKGINDAHISGAACGREMKMASLLRPCEVVEEVCKGDIGYWIWILDIGVGVVVVERVEMR